MKLQAFNSDLSALNTKTTLLWELSLLSHAASAGGVGVGCHRLREGVVLKFGAAAGGKDGGSVLVCVAGLTMSSLGLSRCQMGEVVVVHCCCRSRWWKPWHCGFKEGWPIRFGWGIGGGRANKGCRPWVEEAAAGNRPWSYGRARRLVAADRGVPGLMVGGGQEGGEMGAP